MKKIINELLDLKAGWAGLGTIPPSPCLVEDLKNMIDVNLQSSRMPDDVEVDEEDGSIALYWTHRALGRSFALIFQRRGQVIGVLAELGINSGYAPWSLPLDDTGSLQEKLSHPAVKDLLTNKEHERTNK